MVANDVLHCIIQSIAFIRDTSKHAYLCISSMSKESVPWLVVRNQWRWGQKTQCQPHTLKNCTSLLNCITLNSFHLNIHSNKSLFTCLQCFNKLLCMKILPQKRLTSEQCELMRWSNQSAIDSVAWLPW